MYAIVLQELEAQLASRSSARNCPWWASLEAGSEAKPAHGLVMWISRDRRLLLPSSQISPPSATHPYSCSGSGFRRNCLFRDSAGFCGSPRGFQPSKAFQQAIGNGPRALYPVHWRHGQAKQLFRLARSSHFRGLIRSPSRRPERTMRPMMAYVTQQPTNDTLNTYWTPAILFFRSLLVMAPR